MDPQVEWLRRRIIAGIVRRLVFVLVVVSGGGFAGSFLGLELDITTSVATGALAGVVVAAMWFVVSLFTNPLNLAFLGQYLGTAMTLSQQRPAAFVDLSATDRGEAPDRVRFLFSITDDEPDAPPGYDVLLVNGVVAARSPNTGSLHLYSRLDDGRIVCTSRQASPPHERLVVNVASDGTTTDLFCDHAAFLTRLQLTAGLNATADPMAPLEHLVIEQSAFRQLGRTLSALFGVERRPAPHRLVVTPRPDDLRTLAAERMATPRHGQRVLQVRAPNQPEPITPGGPPPGAEPGPEAASAASLDFSTN